jgi:hypothetical protein
VAMIGMSACALMAPAPLAGASAPRVPVCATPSLQVDFGSTGLAASHVNAYLLFANRSSASCSLHGYPSVRYVNARGVAFGNPSKPDSQPHGTVILAAGGAAHALFSESVPGVWSPTACEEKHAAGLRVTPPGSSHAVVLRFPGMVCSGPTIHESTTASVSSGPGPTPGRCTQTQLVTSLGHARGTAGTTNVPLVFKNPVVYTCVVHGYPSVSSVSGPHGTRVGPPPADQPGRAPYVWVQPFGGTASATLGIVATGVYTPSACQAKPASGLKVRAPHSTHATYLAYRHLVCTQRTSTHVVPVVAGPSG